MADHFSIWKFLILLSVNLILAGVFLYRFRKHFLHKKQTWQEEQNSLLRKIKRKNELLSTMTHELRTPLSVLRTSLDILLEERPGPLTEQQQILLESSVDNVLRLIRFSNSILAVVKIDSSGFKLSRSPADLRTIIRSVCREMKPWMNERGVELRYSYPNLLRKVMIDPTWIGQVLINLIHNAGKHLNRDGRVDVSVIDNKSSLVVSVADNGRGIENTDKPHIFVEFYQGRDEERLDGAGLGLTIVRDVIHMHGGEVYVSSVEGLGTTLSFTLPDTGTLADTGSPPPIQDGI
ncbi:sensor histidine kinase KdpD [Oceanispirochaeta sp.]|jgi:signal transduction histidine kinase|uniref:sensor histidine kinase n=1 Tax=Oceanispirochaeta sp. TaxID=2035350 RepID=UPI00261F764B|nr:HAMP domain-containing sensor histidine kinase [Oceanispirochaeta sp.]MDA3955969.1 HAMP domain-containing sensor histidine kinase [Oceanispirochaeta sp.]